MKTKIGLLYGGKSAEHKVSLQTALAVTKALDFNKFDIFPVYITVDGQWVAGKQLMGPAQTVEELKLIAENSGNSNSLTASMTWTKRRGWNSTRNAGIIKSSIRREWSFSIFCRYG